jgi:hypothetical protein
MFGFSPLELVALGIVALGVFSVLGVVAFKIFENVLEPKRWHADQLESGKGRSFEEREIMGSQRGSLGDRITAVERRLPSLKKPLEGDPVDRLLASLPDVDELPVIGTKRMRLPGAVDEEE